MKIKFSTVLLPLLAVSFMVGCSKSSSEPITQEPDVPPVVKPKTNVVNVSVVDSASGKPLSAVSLNVIGSAFDITEKPINSFVTNETGLISFYSKAGENIKVIASKSDYVNSGTEATVMDGANNRVIRLLKADPKNTPAGVEMTLESVETDSSGAIAVEKVIDINNTKAAVTKITIPADTVLKTASGEPVVGAVAVQAVHYDANTTESFPGGLTALVENAPDKNGTEQEAEVNFISAGFTSIQMTDDNGNSVKKFEGQKIEIAMTLPKDTINPETGVVVKIGDEIPIWSYDVESGKWQYEEMGEVADVNDSKNFAVIYKASHLSYWNLDWHYGAVCRPANINITDLEKGTTVVTSLELKGQGFNKTVFDYNGDGSFELNNTPKYLPLTLTLSYDGVVKDTKQVIFGDNDCKADVAAGSITPKEPVKVTVVEECRDGSHRKVLPSISTFLLSGGAWTYLASSNNDGNLKVMLDPGAEEATSIYAIAPGNSYTNYYEYKNIPAGTTDDQTIKFIYNSSFDSYCFPATGGGN